MSFRQEGVIPPPKYEPLKSSPRLALAIFINQKLDNFSSLCCFTHVAPKEIARTLRINV